MIHGVRVKQLKMIPDERGMLMEILRRDDEVFRQFGQAYITTAYSGVVKGWHYHKIQWDHFCCIYGTMKLVLYDPRPDSPTKGEVQEFFMGWRNPIVVAIPPGVYHGFKCVGDMEGIMLNIPTEPYHHAQPDEYRTVWNDPAIPYDWMRKNG